MPKHRRSIRHRKAVAVAAALLAVGVPSTAAGLVDWQDHGHGAAHAAPQEAAQPYVPDSPAAAPPSPQVWRTAWTTHAPHRRHRRSPVTHAPATPAARARAATTPAARRTSPRAAATSSRPRTTAASSSTAPAPSVTATAPAPTPTPTPTVTATPTASPSTSGGGLSGAAAEVLTLVNTERRKAGCAPLTADARLTSAAEAHSQDMAAHQTMSHTGSDGSSPADRIRAAGYDATAWGENIAYGYDTAAGVMAAWMSSPGHRANILDCGFRNIGIGTAAPGGYWTQDFGTR